MHRISVAALGFLTTGPIPEGMFTIDPIPEGIPKVALPFQRSAEKKVNSSQPSTKGEKGIVEVFNFEDFEDNFEVFNQTLLPEIPFGDLGHSLPAQTSQA